MSLDKFGSVSVALETLARRAGSLARAGLGSSGSQARIFAYACGFKKSPDQVCDLLTLLKVNDPAQMSNAVSDSTGSRLDDYMGNPYDYLYSIAVAHQRGGWGEWIRSELDEQQARNVAANLSRHPGVTRVLERLLPELSIEELNFLLSVDDLQSAKGLTKIRGARKFGTEMVGSPGKLIDASSAAWKVHRAGGSDMVKSQAQRAQKIVMTLASRVLTQVELLEMAESLGIADMFDMLLLARLDEAGDTTLPLVDVASLLRDKPITTEGADDLFFGLTPMCATLDKVAKRFGVDRHGLSAQPSKDSSLAKILFRAVVDGVCQSGLESRADRESPGPDADRVLLIVSDGCPTDGDPRPIVETMRARGVIVISCFVTNRDLKVPRSLVAAPEPGWDDAARLMFDCASVAHANMPQTRFLVENGWSVPDGARFFAQVNHSTILSEFFQSLLG